MTDEHGHRFAVYSATGVHIGLWNDGITAAKVLEEYPGGCVEELVTLDHARALVAAEREACAGVGWKPIETAPVLENVLICQDGIARNMTTAYKGDGSPKHPAVWINIFDRQPLSEFEQPTHWMPLPPLPSALTPAPVSDETDAEDARAALAEFHAKGGKPMEQVETEMSVEEAAREDAFFSLCAEGVAEADRAMKAFPQPNYVISKVAEEAGEVVKAAIHCAEGRESPAEVRAEMTQLIAMLYRLWIEGDQVHGLRALAGQEVPTDA